MKRQLSIIAILLVSFFMIPEAVEGELFDIGDEKDEFGSLRPDVNDFLSGKINIWTVHNYDTGSMLFADKVDYNGPGYVENLTRMFDGNLTTGCNASLVGSNDIYIMLLFPYPLYVNNITFKTMFEGNESRVEIFGVCIKSQPFWMLQGGIVDGTKYYINGTLDGIWLKIHPYDTTLNFRDVIINYTQMPGDQDSILNAIDQLNEDVGNLNNRLENITSIIGKMNDTVTEMNDTIAGMNTTLNGLNKSLQKIQQNLTELWKQFNNLNLSYQSNLLEYFAHNMSVYRNISRIDEIINQLEDGIDNLNSSLSQVNGEPEGLNEIREQISETSMQMSWLKDNITEILDLLPTDSEKNQSEERISQLESENEALRQEVTNLTSSIENLTIDTESLTTVVNEVRSAQEKDDRTENNADMWIIIISFLLLLFVCLALMTLLIKRSIRRQMKDLSGEESPNLNGALKIKTATNASGQSAALGKGIVSPYRTIQRPVPMVPSPHALADADGNLMALPPHTPPGQPRMTMVGLRHELIKHATDENIPLSEDETLSLLQNRLKKGEISEETFTNAREALVEGNN